MQKLPSFLILILGLTLLPFYQLDVYAQTANGIMDVVFIDLGSAGDSTLIIFPNGKTMLIDGGLKNGYPNVKSVLDEYNVDTINLMLATHSDRDHVNGLTELLQNGEFQVDEIWVNPIEDTGSTYQEFLTSANGINVVVATVGKKIELDNTVDAQIVSPPDYLIEADGTTATLDNSNSLVTKIVYNGVSFLFTGDATHTTEDWLIVNQGSFDSLDIDIMNGLHHGTKYANSENFIQVTTPNLVIFSANENNQYGHPHPEAIQRYENAGVRTLQTGLVGDVVIQTDGTRCSLFLDGEPEQPCYSGITIVPEFSLAVIVLVSALVPTILLSKRKTSYNYGHCDNVVF